MDARYRESYARMVEMVGVLYRSGVPLVIGTDGNGFLMLPREFEVFVSADGDPLINVSDMRKVRTVLRGNRLYDTTALFQAVGLAPAP